MRGVTEPRVYTPPLRPLTPDTSFGFSVIEFARDVLEMELLPWQEWLAIHMLEKLPNGSLRFRNVVVLVARQNGKSTLFQVISLWFLYVYRAGLVIGTAQDLDVAEEIWQGAVEFVESTPELDALKESVIRVNGKKTLLLRSGERYKVKAANRRAGRGLSGDLILLDELREHQSWDAWGAITKTTMARPDALVVAMSNAGDAASVVLRYLRNLAHAALGDPDGVNRDEYADPSTAAPAEIVEDSPDDGDDTLGIFEWSAAPGCDVWDRDGWAQANPSLGFTITERNIASACRTDPEWIFRTEVLCQWPDATIDGPFPPGAWEMCADEDSRRAPGADVALCVDVSADRATAWVGLATTRDDGAHHVEIVARRAGTDWVADWLTSTDRSEDVRRAPVAVQARGAPASSLVTPLRDAGVSVVEWGGSDLGGATGALYDRVRAASERGDVTLWHRSQPALNIAAATASTRPLGDAWVWDRRKSTADSAPLIAVTGALWCLTYAKPAAPVRSVYETRGMAVL